MRMNNLGAEDKYNQQPLNTVEGSCVVPESGSDLLVQRREEESHDSKEEDI